MKFWVLSFLFPTRILLSMSAINLWRLHQNRKYNCIQLHLTVLYSWSPLTILNWRIFSYIVCNNHKDFKTLMIDIEGNKPVIFGNIKMTYCYTTLNWFVIIFVIEILILIISFLFPIIIKWYSRELILYTIKPYLITRKQMSSSPDPTTNYESTNLNFHDFFYQLQDIFCFFVRNIWLIKQFSKILDS